jgi:hypothetical protein
VGERINSTVAVTESEDWNVRGFHVSGRPEASSEPHDMRVERMPQSRRGRRAVGAVLRKHRQRG